jgi:hypothetical protein
VVFCIPLMRAWRMLVFSYGVVLFCFEAGSHLLRLALNSWLSCFHLLSAGIIDGAIHHTWLMLSFLMVNSSSSGCCCLTVSECPGMWQYRMGWFSICCDVLL